MIIAYFIGGPADLTKLVLPENSPPGTQYVLTASQLNLTVPPSNDGTVKADRHEYLLRGKLAHMQDAYIYEYRPS